MGSFQGEDLPPSRNLGSLETCRFDVGWSVVPRKPAKCSPLYWERQMGLFSKDIKTLDDLFVHQLQDIYYAEQQLVKAIPKLADKATSPELKQGLLKHLEE